MWQEVSQEITQKECVESGKSENREQEGPGNPNVYSIEDKDTTEG